MKTKKFLILIIMAIIFLPNISQAALQANPNTQYKKTDTPASWMTSIRQMEASGGAMGLTETFESDYTSKTSNNIDVHMMRTTEYGAIAILSASGYGNSNNSQAITSTTGNNTGVILNTANWEWTAGTSSSFSTDKRYWDQYANDSGATYKVGDALVECQGWHKASKSSWVYSSGPFFLRGLGGLFSFNYNCASNSYYCRGVAVCGAGL